MDEIKQNEKKHDKIAGIYNFKHDEIYNGYEQKRLTNVISKLVSCSENKTNISVLDFGSGTGNLSLKFLKQNCNVTSCDVSQKSLDILTKQLINNKNHIAKKIGEGKLPFPNNSFDIVATYSVLHHIPDYLFAVKEMIRVCKVGGLVYIDHEVNKNRWNPSENLKTWYKISDQTKTEHLFKLVKTGELFTFSFIKAVFYKIFINRRYEREGDIHVWAEDHIEWEKINGIFKAQNCSVIEEHDYLLYKPKANTEFSKFKDICNDTKYVIFRKH